MSPTLSPVDGPPLGVTSRSKSSPTVKFSPGSEFLVRYARGVGGVGVVVGVGVRDGLGGPVLDVGGGVRIVESVPRLELIVRNVATRPIPAARHPKTAVSN